MSSKYIFSRKFPFWKKGSLLPPRHCLQVNPHISPSPTLMQRCFFAATALILQTLVCLPLLKLHFPSQSPCTFSVFFSSSGRNLANSSKHQLQIAHGVSRDNSSPQLLQSSLSRALCPTGDQGSCGTSPFLNDLPGWLLLWGQQQHPAAASISCG